MLKPAEYPKVIKEIEDFRDKVIEYYRLRKESHENDPFYPENPEIEKKKQELRQEINQKAPAIKQYFNEINFSSIIDCRAPAVAGAFPYSIDVLFNIFETGSFAMGPQKTIDILNNCIGQYKYLVDTKQTIVDIYPKSIFEAINAINQNLRKCFKQQPANEIEVQDEIEKILNVRQIKNNRDSETFNYSSKSYKPDFVLEELETAIEVKLCNSKGDEKKIISEINDDILAYQTRYKMILFFIYDIGIIQNEEKFKRNLTDNPNVMMFVVKH